MVWKEFNDRRQDAKNKLIEASEQLIRMTSRNCDGREEYTEEYIAKIQSNIIKINQVIYEL